MLPGGTTNEQQGKIVLLSLWAVGRLSFAIRFETVVRKVQVNQMNLKNLDNIKCADCKVGVRTV